MPETGYSKKRKSSENEEKKEKNGLKRGGINKEGIKGEGKNEETEILPTLVNALKNDLSPVLKEIEVKDVRIGLAYTGVLLSENYGGVACTPLYEF